MSFLCSSRVRVQTEPILAYINLIQRCLRQISSLKLCHWNLKVDLPETVKDISAESTGNCLILRSWLISDCHRYNFGLLEQRIEGCTFCSVFDFQTKLFETYIHYWRAHTIAVLLSFRNIWRWNCLKIQFCKGVKKCYYRFSLHSLLPKDSFRKHHFIRFSFLLLKVTWCNILQHLSLFFVL